VPKVADQLAGKTALQDTGAQMRAIPASFYKNW